MFVQALIFPLVMALLNNFLELRSDAFKMTVHNRRPIPTRTDTIGPWLDALTFLTWLSALTNSALVYLFYPRSQVNCSVAPSVHISQLDKVHEKLFSGGDEGLSATKELLKTVLLIAFAASHGYIFLRVVVRHLIEKMFWKGSKEVEEQEKVDREIKNKFLQGFLVEDNRKSQETGVITGEERQLSGAQNIDSETVLSFWGNDEGLDEILRISKEV